MATSTQSSPTQDFVPIKEIRDGVVMTSDTEMRAVLICSSLNLSLKSADEQQAIIGGFQTFLNSLEFSCQIFVQSRRLDIRPYIALLEDRAKNIPEDLLKVQIREYIEFIKDFTDKRNIMTKNFFVVVPYGIPLIGAGGMTDKLPFGKKSETAASKQARIEQFEEARSQLEQRISVVSQGLTRVGVRVARLGTEEIVELFYKLFNPGETDKPIIN
jgi:hypothetical protein